MESNDHNIKETILRKIQAHEIVMRPRLYFVLHMAALVVVTLAAIVISIFIFNFILFSIRINNQDAFLNFGPRGILAFLYFFPWSLFGLDIALIILLQFFLRKLRFGYKIPILYLLAGLIVSVLVFGFIIDRSSDINDRFLRGADEHRLPPPFGGIYSGARHMPARGSGICVCTIRAIEGNILTVEDTRSSTTLRIILPPDDPHATTSSLIVGGRVFIAGDEDDGVIRAFGVRSIYENNEIKPPRGAY
jgi:hypothetical protein